MDLHDLDTSDSAARRVQLGRDEALNPRSRRLPLRATVALLAALALPAAHAQVSGKVLVDWHSLAIKVIDTSAEDGVEAGFQWTFQESFAGGFLDGTGPLPDYAWHFDWTSDGGFVASGPMFSVEGDYGAGRLYAKATATGGPMVGSRIERRGRMVFTGEGRIRAEVDMQAAVTAGPGQNDAWAYADANLYFGDSNRTSLSPVAYARADLSNGGSRAERLSVTLDFRAGETAWLMSQPGVVLQPVPEPGTWALWLAGLAAVGVMARRRSPAAVTNARAAATTRHHSPSR